LGAQSGPESPNKNQPIFVLIWDVFWATSGMDFEGQNKVKIVLKMVPKLE
jgi:hypothetical protein